MPESKGLQHPQGDNPEGRQGQVQPRPPLQPQRLGLLEQVHPFDPAGGSANIQPAAVRMERRCRSADQDASIGRIPAWGGAGCMTTADDADTRGPGQGSLREETSLLPDLRFPSGMGPRVSASSAVVRF